MVWAGEQVGQKLKKNKKIDTWVDNFTYMGTRPHWTYNYQIWCEGSRRRCNHWWQILSRSVKEFSVCGGPKMGVCHWLELSPLQQVSTTVLPVNSKLQFFTSRATNPVCHRQHDETPHTKFGNYMFSGGVSPYRWSCQPPCLFFVLFFFSFWPSCSPAQTTPFVGEMSLMA